MSVARALPLAPLPGVAPTDVAASLFTAAHQLLLHLEQGRAIDAALLRSVMEEAFGGSAAAGAWHWKTAYEACEAAAIFAKVPERYPIVRVQARAGA